MGWGRTKSSKEIKIRRQTCEEQAKDRVGKQEGGYEWTKIVEKMRLVKMHEAKP